MTQNDQAAMNEQLTELRLNGLSIDGDNRYKQDLIDAVIGAMMFGAQGANPPPAGHWLEQFYVIAREEREALARVEAERDAVLAKAPTQWAYDQACRTLHKHRELANTAQALVREVDAYLSGHGDNAICNGSRLHQDIKDLLAGQLAVAGTTSDQYRAELYDEVWQKARDMGYGNVTEALIALERTKPAAGEPLVPIGYVSNHAAQDLVDGKLCTITPDRMLDDGQGWEVPVYTAPPAAAHEDDVVAVVGTVPDGSGFKSLDFKVDLQDLPDGTRLYAMGRGGAPT